MKDAILSLLIVDLMFFSSILMVFIIDKLFK